MRSQARRNLRHILPVLLSLGSAATAATVAQTPPAAQNQPSQSQSSAAPYTLRTRAHLVVLDVVVTDSHGVPIRGLTQSDFSIFENNVQMDPNSFQAHTSQPQPGESGPTITKPIRITFAPNTFTNVIPADNRPLDILLIDSLNVPSQLQQREKNQMLDYVGSMSPGTRLAVFILTPRLVMLQSFTSDPELLRNAIASSSNAVKLATLEDPYQDRTAANVPSADEPIGLVVEKEGDAASARAQGTLAALTQLARYLAGVPGRKNLIWFTGGFPLEFPPVLDGNVFPPPYPQYGVVADAQAPAPQLYDYSDQMKAATDQLARAHVAVFPIDARGLQYVDPDEKNVTSKNNEYMRLGEHAAMQTIAQQTGGHATYNSSGIRGQLAQAVDDGANYYTLTYTPPDQKWTGAYRKVRVNIDRPGLSLTYRPGYYAGDPQDVSYGRQGPTPTLKMPQATPMQSALMRGSPVPTQILFKATVAESPTPQTTVPADDQPNPRALRPPYLNCVLTLAIDIRDIAFTPGPDGNYRADFEYTAVAYDPLGDQVLDTASREVRPIVPPAVYQSMLHNGANAHLQIVLPDHGASTLRIAVHDLSTDRVGAIEIPSSVITPTPLSAAIPPTSPQNIPPR